MGLGSELGRALLPVLIGELGRRKGKKVSTHFAEMLTQWDAIKALADRVGQAADDAQALALTSEEVKLLDKLCDEVESIAVRLRR